MTRYNEKQIEQMKTYLINQRIKDFYYEKDDDYYVIILEDGSEFCFRFMADLCE